jgi:hypothetical protein
MLDGLVSSHPKYYDNICFNLTHHQQCDEGKTSLITLTPERGHQQPARVQHGRARNGSTFSKPEIEAANVRRRPQKGQRDLVKVEKCAERQFRRRQ